MQALCSSPPQRLANLPAKVRVRELLGGGKVDALANRIFAGRWNRLALVGHADQSFNQVVDVDHGIATCDQTGNQMTIEFLQQLEHLKSVRIALP